MQIKMMTFLIMSTLSIYATDPTEPSQASGRSSSVRKSEGSVLAGAKMRLSPIAEERPERIIDHKIIATHEFMKDLGCFEVIIPSGNSLYQSKYILEYLKYFKEFIVTSLEDFSVIKGVPLAEIKTNSQHLLNLEASLIERRLAKFKEGSGIELPSLLRFTFY